jgi:hypothetical protein
MWYDRFMLLTPDSAEQTKSRAARLLLEQVGVPTLAKMNFYIQAAGHLEHTFQQKGAWDTLPERRLEFLRIMKLIQQCAVTLSVTLQHNRSAMLAHNDGSEIWGLLGQN